MHDLLTFLRSEVCACDENVDNTNTEALEFASRRREKVYTFVKIPKELEKLMGYGFFQCADAFLYVFTFLPIRCFLSCCAAIRDYYNSRTVRFSTNDKCEVIKIVILVVCSYLFMYIDTNVLYHVIKSQSVIKLYIFFNMLEVGDRLFGCFTQDTLDALFITATENVSGTKKRLSTPSHVIICGVSILGHALVILLQSTTLSVAINANNRALLTVMMSNNFVELKGSVFKKFDKINLFQVSCSDIRERFHLFVLLLIVCLQTLREYSWEESRFWVLLPDCLMVLIAEIGVDWIKHAFITRFNELPLQVYDNYVKSLAYDLADSVKRKQSGVGYSDYSDVVGRRLGFVPLPLAIVLIRVVFSPILRGNQVFGNIILCVFGFFALATFRVLNLVVLLGKAVKIINSHSGRLTRKAGSEGDLRVKKIQFTDTHLFANSNVSLFSVGFNEALIKVEPFDDDDRKHGDFEFPKILADVELPKKLDNMDLPPFDEFNKKHDRKHSLDCEIEKKIFSDNSVFNSP